MEYNDPGGCMKTFAKVIKTGTNKNPSYKAKLNAAFGNIRKLGFVEAGFINIYQNGDVLIVKRDMEPMKGFEWIRTSKIHNTDKGFHCTVPKVWAEEVLIDRLVVMEIFPGYVRLSPYHKEDYDKYEYQ